MQLERPPIARRSQLSVASRVIAALVFLGLACAAALPASAATLDRIKETGRIKLGYLTDARPFTFRNDAGNVEGYGASLCERIAERIKAQFSLPSLTVDWVPVTSDDRLRDVEQGNVDLLCAPAAVTFSRLKQGSFSIPVFPAGARAVLRADAPQDLRNALSEAPGTRPVWRGSPAQTVLAKTRYAVVTGTTTVQVLERAKQKFHIDATVVPVPDYRTGLQLLQQHQVDVFFGDRAVVLGAIDPGARKNFLILDRMLTHEPIALALARGDEDFRLVVDRALSELYPTPVFADLYRKWIGDFDDSTRTFFAWNTIQP